MVRGQMLRGYFPPPTYPRSRSRARSSRTRLAAGPSPPPPGGERERAVRNVVSAIKLVPGAGLDVLRLRAARDALLAAWPEVANGN